MTDCTAGEECGAAPRAGGLRYSLSRRRLRRFFCRHPIAPARQRLFDIAERRAVSYAMARLCKHVGLKGNQSATPHDFRRSVSTWLGDHGERTDVIDTILGHSPQGVSRKHYNLSLLLPPVVQALQRWADHLDELLREGLKTAADWEP